MIHPIVQDRSLTLLAADESSNRRYDNCILVSARDRSDLLHSNWMSGGQPEDYWARVSCVRLVHTKFLLQ